MPPSGKESKLNQGILTVHSFDCAMASSNPSQADLEALRAKYSAAGSQQAAVRSSAAAETDSAGKSKLDKIKICTACNGAGCVQQKYQFLVNTVECTRCSGEGVLES